MQEIYGDLWKLWDAPNTNVKLLCITTNGYVKPNGNAVMGRGCALEMKQRFPGSDKALGANIKVFGNHVNKFLTWRGHRVYSFPVKHNWWEKADIELIKRSCTELTQILECWEQCFLPRPGCGNGGLDWKEVSAIISPLLPDNVWVVSK